MSKSTTAFNGRGFPEVSSAHHTIAGATATIKTSSVTQIASISGNSSFVQMSHNSSSPGTPVSKMLPSSHRVNAGIAIIPSKPNPSRTDRVPSSSLQNTTQKWTSPYLTGIDISTHSDMESPVDNLSPRQMGAIIGGSVGVTAIILVAIAVFFVLQRRRRGRYAVKQTTKLSSEKKGKIGKARQLSSYGLALSTNQTNRAQQHVCQSNFCTLRFYRTPQQLAPWEIEFTWSIKATPARGVASFFCAPELPGIGHSELQLCNVNGFPRPAP
ncbi:hypothetical protein I7I51_00966, partial [Histoplasma capsulatum]